MTHPTGQWYQIIEPSAAKLRAYFEAGIPVIVSPDGRTFRAERRLPADAGPQQDG